jgi:hypothetical protein
VGDSREETVEVSLELPSDLRQLQTPH